MIAADLASAVVALWGDANAPAECADWTISDEGNGTGAVQAKTGTSAGGIDAVARSIDYAAQAFTIHMIAADLASAVVALWGDANAPTECGDWTATDEGDGTGAVQAKTNTSAGGAIASAPIAEYANGTFTIHTIPAVTTAVQVKALWAGSVSPECADWICEDEGVGGGVVAATTDTSANGADAVGALVNLSFYTEV
jgi:hypothetical protein